MKAVYPRVVAAPFAGAFARREPLDRGRKAHATNSDNRAMPQRPPEPEPQPPRP